MKYGESAFDIFYLCTAVIIGLLILFKARNRNERLMGLAVLILGLGDAFHLVPRVLNYFVDADFTFYLEGGKLVTSITMTVFYILLYHVGCGYYHVPGPKYMIPAVYLWALIRVVVCLLPQNGWLQNDSSITWGIIRNVPFVALGLIVIILYFQCKDETRRFRFIWLYALLSFLFYIPVAVFAGILPILGMLMLPKTVCYLFMIFTLYKAVTKDEPR